MSEHGVNLIIGDVYAPETSLASKYQENGQCPSNNNITYDITL